MFSTNSKQDSLTDKVFVGIVEQNVDPKRKARIKVRVQGIFNEIPLEHIPWASPYAGTNGKCFNVPSIGKMVSVFFSNGNIYEPQYVFSENFNINLQDKLKDLSDDEYSKFIALIFDERTQVSSDDTALNLDYFGNVIRIKNNDIDVKLKDTSQRLNLGHSYCNQEAVLGTNFFKWFDGFMTTLRQPTALNGNFAAPILKPTIDAKIDEYWNLRENFVSKQVKIVDNDSVQKDAYIEDRKSTPVNDDSTKINNEKILEKSKTPKTPEEEKQKEVLQEKVKEERIKDVVETVKNTPNDMVVDGSISFQSTETGKDVTINEDKSVRDDTEIQEKVTSLDEEPYGGFWDNYSSEKETTTMGQEGATPGYGKWNTEGGGGGTGGGTGGGNTGAGAGGGGTSGGGGSYPNNNVKIAMDFFISKGWTKEQAAGIVGNLMVESGNFDQNVINGTKKGDSGQAVGIAQWHPSRQSKFQQLYNIPLAGSPFEKQLEFVDWELNNTEKKAGVFIRSCTSARDAAEKVDVWYERSSGALRSTRVDYAEQLVNSPKTYTTVPGSGPTPWVDTAKKELNITEYKDTKRINEYLKSAGAGQNKENTASTPWCASFITWIMVQNKIPLPKIPGGKSVLGSETYGGQGLASAGGWLNCKQLGWADEGKYKYGALVIVFDWDKIRKRWSPSHIAIAVDCGKNNVPKMLGGNQGHGKNPPNRDSVNISSWGLGAKNPDSPTGYQNRYFFVWPK